MVDYKIPETYRGKIVLVRTIPMDGPGRDVRVILYVPRVAHFLEIQLLEPCGKDGEPLGDSDDQDIMKPRILYLDYTQRTVVGYRDFFGVKGLFAGNLGFWMDDHFEGCLGGSECCRQRYEKTLDEFGVECPN